MVVFGLAMLLLIATVGVPLTLAGPADVQNHGANFPDQARIGNVSLSGEGYISEQDELIQDPPPEEFVWRTGGLNMSVNITSGEQNGSFILCGRGYTEDAEAVDVKDCSSFEMENYSQTSVNLSVGDWPDEATGNHQMVLELLKDVAGTQEILTMRSVGVIVIERDGDFTGDGLTNEEEVEIGTDFTIPDTSGNGLTDWEEVRKFGTDPLVLDTTGDGVNDATLVRFGLDPTEPFTAHKHGLVLLLFLTTLGGGFVVATRRLYRNGTLQSALYPSDEATTPSQHKPNGPQVGLETVPDESILTRDEYVCQLLDQNGDRMKQSQIVEITSWSKAKVSRVLSELEEEGKLRKIQVGRENLIELKKR